MRVDVGVDVKAKSNPCCTALTNAGVCSWLCFVAATMACVSECVDERENVDEE
jgi:hypothetical protein